MLVIESKFLSCTVGMLKRRKYACPKFTIIFNTSVTVCVFKTIHIHYYNKSHNDFVKWASMIILKVHSVD